MPMLGVAAANEWAYIHRVHRSKCIVAQLGGKWVGDARASGREDIIIAFGMWWRATTIFVIGCARHTKRDEDLLLDFINV